MANCWMSIWGALLVVLATLAPVARAQSPANGDDAAAAAEVEKLIAILKSVKANEQEKVVACQRLQVIGDASAIPVLASMLGHERLGHAARVALEANPNPVVDMAFRQALGTLKGNSLVGVIGSVGRRRDVKAVDALARHLRSNDLALASAAAMALGKIADDRAVAALEQAFDHAPAPVVLEVFRAYLEAADAAYGQQRRERALEMYSRLLREESVYPRSGRREGVRPIRIAATRGVILASDASQRNMLAAVLLLEPDEEMFRLALGMLKEVEGSELAAAYAARLGQLTSERQILLLDALGAHGDRSIVAAIVGAAESGDVAVRAAALRALAKLGDPAGLPPLVAAATREQAELAEAAKGALAAFPGSDADAAVLAMLTHEAAAQRRVAVEIIAKRGMSSAARALMDATRDADEATRLGAIRALGEVASVNDVWMVVRALLEAKAGADAEAAERAVAAVIARAEPRQAMAEPLIGAMADAGAARRAALLRLLCAAGGPKALETVRNSAKGLDKQVQDAAIRALCEWQSADAAPDVLAVAKGSENPVHKRLALRAYVRLIGDKNLTAEQRGAMCREAAALAQSVDDKRLALGTLGATPTKEALEVAVAWMDDSAVSEEAVAAAIAIAKTLRASEPEAVNSALVKAAGVAKNDDLRRRINALLGRPDGNNP